MSDNRTRPPPLPPLPPAPVLSYEIAAPPPPIWLARLICGLAIGYGTVSVGYVAASRVPGVMSVLYPRWGLPAVICGIMLTVFGALGVFRVKGSRLGIAISCILLVLCNWTWQWGFLELYGPPDGSTIAYAVVSFADYTVIPIFVVICLIREPIKGCFTPRRGPEMGAA